MAVIRARISAAGLYPGVLPGLSIELNQLDPWLWSAASYPAPTGRTGERHKVAPRAAGRTVRGYIGTSFYDDFYNRVHVTPVVIDLGNLVSEQIRTVAVWNAYLTPQTLSDTPMEGGEGIDIVPPGTLPMEFRPLQEREWQLNISTDGPAIVAASWVFKFAGLDPVTVTITGDRIVPWSFVPDWAEGITERLGWLTDVLPSPTRAEQRRALRLSPTRRFEVRSLLEGPERANFDVAVYSWGGRTWAMPVWPDLVWLAAPVAAGAAVIPCDTQHREFVAGGLALLRAGDLQRTRRYEVVEISDVTPDSIILARPTVQAWPRGARLYPLRLAELVGQPQVRRLSDTTAEARYLFDVVEPCDWPAIMPPTAYRGRPVLEQAPDESEEPSFDWERAQLRLDNPTGWGRRTDTAASPATLQQHRWALEGIAARSAHRSLLYALAGRWKELWVPTFAADLKLLDTVGASGTTLAVHAIDYARFGLGRVGRRDIRIELTDGTAFHRRITAAALVDDDTEHLAIDAPLGVEVPPRQVRRISFMALCRSETDQFELVHLTDAEGVARSSLIFRSIRDDV